MNSWTIEPAAFDLQLIPASVPASTPAPVAVPAAATDAVPDPDAGFPAWDARFGDWRTSGEKTLDVTPVRDRPGDVRWLICVNLRYLRATLRRTAMDPESMIGFHRGEADPGGDALSCTSGG